MTAQTFAKWKPLPAHHVDCEALRMSQFAQSASTRNGKVPEFKLLNIARATGEKPRIRVTVPEPTMQPVDGCPQPETPIRERAYAIEQYESTPVTNHAERRGE